MERFRRRLFNGLTSASLLLSVIAIVFWVRGRIVNDEVYFNVHSHLIIAGSFPNHFDAIFYCAANYRGRLVEVFAHDKRVPPMPEFWTFRLNANSHRWEVAIPWWQFLLVGLALPGIATSRWVRRSQAIRNGRCLTCGYDLRATPDRCPECGTIPPKKEAVSS